MTKEFDLTKAKLDRALSDLQGSHEANLQKLLKDHKCYVQEHKAMIQMKFENAQKSLQNHQSSFQIKYDEKWREMTTR